MLFAEFAYLLDLLGMPCVKQDDEAVATSLQKKNVLHSPGLANDVGSSKANRDVKSK